MAYGDLWMQLRGPLPSSYVPAFDAVPAPTTRPMGPQGLGLDAGVGLPDAQLGALVSSFLQAQTAGQALDLLDPATRARLEREIKDRFQSLSQSGLPLEARPGSKAAEALANGEFDKLTIDDLLGLLDALIQYAESRRSPGSVAQQHAAPLAPTGSWGARGNSAGGGTAQTGANAPAAAARGPAPAAGPIPEGSPSGRRLAETAQRVANDMNSTGWCYRGVATAVAQATGVQLTGGSAYMAADQLANNSKFKEISVSPDQLKSLPPGAIVVWDRTSASPHGHISVALGNGQEASDHVQSQMTSLRGAQNYRVFVLREGGQG